MNLAEHFRDCVSDNAPGSLMSRDTLLKAAKELDDLKIRIADLEHELAEARKPLRWTSEAPTVAGWYWHRSDPNTFWKTIVHVVQPELASNIGYAFGQWSGPIPAPMP